MSNAKIFWYSFASVWSIVNLVLLATGTFTSIWLALVVGANLGELIIALPVELGWSRWQKK